MRKRTPGMYAFYKNEVVKALDGDDNEQDWAVTYTRVLEYTIDSTGDDQADQDKVEDMVDTPCFPTEFENGVVIEDVKAQIDIYPVEVPEDRVYLNPEDQAIVEKTMAKLQPEGN